MDTEKVLKQEIIKSAEAVKKKVRLLRNQKTESDNALETVLKPITEPLKQLVNRNRTDDQDTSLKSEDIIKKRSTLDNNDNTLNSYFLNKDDLKTTTDYLNQLNSDIPDDCEMNENIQYNTETDSDASLPSKNTDLSNASSYDSSSSLQRPFSTPVSHSPKDFDAVPFGVRIERGKLMMGTSRVIVTNHNIKVGSSVYKKTPGLTELLYKKIPNLKVITNEDKHNYKLLLQKTNAHKRDFDPNKPIKSNKGLKYLHIIKPLFKLSEKCQSTESLPTGKGVALPRMKKMKSRVDYVYWDNPNELVERLKLLIASREAGNTGLENEIISIIEELRENGTLN